MHDAGVRPLRHHAAHERLRRCRIAEVKVESPVTDKNPTTETETSHTADTFSWTKVGNKRQWDSLMMCCSTPGTAAGSSSAAAACCMLANAYGSCSWHISSSSSWCGYMAFVMAFVHSSWRQRAGENMQQSLSYLQVVHSSCQVLQHDTAG